jgi:hypothetical protein
VVRVVLEHAQSPDFVRPFGVGAVVAGHQFSHFAEIGALLHLLDVGVAGDLVDLAPEGANQQIIVVGVQSSDTRAL